LFSKEGFLVNEECWSDFEAQMRACYLKQVPQEDSLQAVPFARALAVTIKEITQSYFSETSTVLSGFQDYGECDLESYLAKPGRQAFENLLMKLDLAFLGPRTHIPRPTVNSKGVAYVKDLQTLSRDKQIELFVLTRIYFSRSQLIQWSWQLLPKGISESKDWDVSSDNDDDDDPFVQDASGTSDDESLGRLHFDGAFWDEIYTQ
jgi:hypothetical protein